MNPYFSETVFIGYAQIVGNGISEVLVLKIFWGRISTHFNSCECKTKVNNKTRCKRCFKYLMKKRLLNKDLLVDRLIDGSLPFSQSGKYAVTV